MTSRRGFLGGAGAAAGAMAALGTPAVAHANAEPFFAPHQGGIVTPQQANIYFAVFDLATDRRDDLIGVMHAWTLASARLQAGLPVDRLGDDPAVPAPDSGEAVGLNPARLTLTFGFGPELFTYQGKDRYGLAARGRRPGRPAGLPRRSAPGGQDRRRCDQFKELRRRPQVAFHAVRQLARIAGGAVTLKWTQTGYCSGPATGATPRNLMGFKDGTMNPKVTDPKAMNKSVWVGPEGPAWMQGGSYMVARRIRIALQHWDQVRLGFQEQVFDRHKHSGAPLGLKDEFAPLDLGERRRRQSGYSRQRPCAARRAGGEWRRRDPASPVLLLQRTAQTSSRSAGRHGTQANRVEYDAGLLFESAIRVIPAPGSFKSSTRCPESMPSTNSRRRSGAGFSPALRAPKRAGI